MFRYFNADMIRLMNFQQFPLGNILFESRLVTSSVELEEKMPLFDLASVVGILSHVCDDRTHRLGRSPIITSAYRRDKVDESDDAYNEYKNHGESWYYRKQKELNLLLALGRYSCYALSDNRGGVPPDTQEMNPSVYSPCQANTVHHSYDISIAFSLHTYLTHTLRNIPLMARFVALVHRVLSRILKL